MLRHTTRPSSTIWSRVLQARLFIRFYWELFQLATSSDTMPSRSERSDFMLERPATRPWKRFMRRTLFRRVLKALGVEAHLKTHKHVPLSCMTTQSPNQTLQRTASRLVIQLYVHPPHFICCHTRSRSRWLSF